MLTQTKSPALAGDPGFQIPLQLDTPKRSKPPRKWQRILAEFARGRSLNRFEAERIGDHALHSTVARLQSFGVVIDRREEVVRGFGGAPTRVMRYRLAVNSAARAAELLGEAHHA